MITHDPFKKLSTQWGNRFFVGYTKFSLANEPENRSITVAIMILISQGSESSALLIIQTPDIT